MSQLTVKDAFVRAALALAAHYFPQQDDDGKPLASFRHAAFFATCKPQAWDRWNELDSEERLLVAEVMKLANPDLADEKRFASAARILLGALETGDEEEDEADLQLFTLAGDPLTADAAYPLLGGDYLGYVRSLLAPFRRPSSRRKPHDFAAPGQTYETSERNEGNEIVHGRVTIPRFPAFTQPLGHEALPILATRPGLGKVPVPVQELKDIAKILDAQYEDTESGPWLHQVLTGLLDRVKARDTDTVDVLDLLAGRTQIFHAPTGTGKSVLVRLMGSWAALNNYRVTLLVPDVKATLASVWDISHDLDILHKAEKTKHLATCAPLMSPYSRHERALKHASLVKEDPDSPGEWGKRGRRDVDHLAYGCAQRHWLDSAGIYRPGQENCLSLRGGGEILACPWIPTCGKFTPAYQAADATVIVTNHHNFIQGSMRVGIQIDGRPVRSVTVREFVLRASDFVIIDEIDAFQAVAVDRCATTVDLHSRRPWTAEPQILDTAAKHLPLRFEDQLIEPVSHVRLMAESLLTGLCTKAFRLNHHDDVRVPRLRHEYDYEGWRLPRSKDRELISLLFPEYQVGDGEPLPREAVDRLNALVPGPEVADDDELAPPPMLLDPEWERVGGILRSVVSPRGINQRDVLKLRLHEALAPMVTDGRARNRAIDHLLIRTLMGELDGALAVLRDTAQSLRHSGLLSANRIIDSMRSGGIADVLPHGAIGRPINGYRVTGMKNPEKDAKLSTQHMAGDPHTYVSELGGLVSLITAGVERPVFGLSATAYFPQAVKEHVHAPVMWWMTDAQEDSILVESSAVTYGSGHRKAGERIPIAGQFPSDKPEALREIGERLYETKLSRKLARLAKSDPARARVILTANSYEQCGHLATGLAKAKGLSHRVCVLVREEDRLSNVRYLPDPSLARRITVEEVEEFPQFGDILIAPLANIARGLNIVVNLRSAIHSIYLCVRPPLIIDDPTWMYGSVNAAGINSLPVNGCADPTEALKTARAAARDHLATILRSSPQLSTMDLILQEQMVAGMLVSLIQLAGRARRGGTNMELHFVDYAFHDETWSSDLASIIERMASRWLPEERRQMADLYGEAVNAFLSYAGVDLTLSS
ncbi:hypothetical protein ABT063_33505 [Streptomyces sp. NPDC002838]|uniref:hypothetical protein n=1 Tax=Streptomyces sp. NPDC002838 TaxID=3154436 RepID=UPI003329B0EF